jgi:hypothetical protein
MEIVRALRRERFDVAIPSVAATAPSSQRAHRRALARRAAAAAILNRWLIANWCRSKTGRGLRAAPPDAGRVAGSTWRRRALI